jgi:hypothetical protein
MRVQDIGAGSILIGVPDGQKGPTLSDGATPAHPLVSGDAAGKPIPTNDWWSSLLYNYFGDAYSAPMYADPLALKADAAGLELSYQPNHRLINGSPSDPVWEGVKYEYTFNPTVHVGIDGLNASAATAAGYGDWTVTAQWQSAGAGLEATFGHGLPFVYFQRTGGGDAVVDLFQDAPVNRIDSPTAQLTYTVIGLTGQYRPGGATHFFFRWTPARMRAMARKCASPTISTATAGWTAPRPTITSPPMPPPAGRPIRTASAPPPPAAPWPTSSTGR